MIQWRSEAVQVAGLEAGVVGLGPATKEDRPRWYLVTRDGWLRGIDFDDGSEFFAVRLPLELAAVNAATVCASDDGRFIAVTPSTGVEGALYDRAEGKITRLARSDYHADVSGWATAILRHAGRDVLVYATAWNRLEARALPSFQLLAPSTAESGLDYFWGLAAVSPGGTRIASFGWHWQPVGAVRFVDVPAWLESQADPPPGPTAGAVLADWWDGEVCWLDEQRFVVAGARIEPDDFYMASMDGVVIINAETGAIERYVPGFVPTAFGVDGPRLVMLGRDDTRAVSLETGEVIAAGAPSDTWHPGARVALSCPALRKHAGPCVLHWLTGSLPGVERASDEASVEARAVLADALEERGLTGDAVTHLRSAQPHGRRCWAVEASRNIPTPASRGDK